MNRIILIGNGFDCAHGLYTRYSDFIDWFWERQLDEVNYPKPGIMWKIVSNNIDPNHPEHYRIYQHNDFDVKIEIADWEKLDLVAAPKVEKTETMQQGQTNETTAPSNKKKDEQKTDEQIPKFKNVKELKKYIQYKNKFLELIDKKKKLQNWVDIEELYFEVLTNCKNRKMESESVYEIYTVEELNRDFRNIRNALAAFIQGRNNTISGSNHFKTELEKDVVAKVKKLILKDIVENDTILLLNFNYSNTVFEFYKTIEKEEGKEEGKEKVKKEFKEDDSGNLRILSIHGRVGAGDNPMIFGYGDELSEDSVEIEKLNDNHFLENVKSIKYIETNNYLRFLEFLKNPYDVFVFGHSCGNSDRTLLKELFENENCKQIRCFYYKDDFSKTVDNIYRKFTDKTAFRKKILQKGKDDDFPQITDENIIPEAIKAKTPRIETQPESDNQDKIPPKKPKESDYKLDYGMIEVTKDYCISKYPVTQKQYENITGKKPSYFKGVDLPVEQVSWFDAIEFCNELSARYQLGKYYNRNGDIVTFNLSANGFRLPTDTEWEYAARGGNLSENFEYSGSNQIKDVAWYYENSGIKELKEKDWDYNNLEKYKCRTHEVGQLKPNELGLYDMSGNVWEWCEDWYDNEKTYRVLRGGSWNDDAEHCRVSDRNGLHPADRYSFVGFRLVCSL